MNKYFERMEQSPELTLMRKKLRLIRPDGDYICISRCSIRASYVEGGFEGSGEVLSTCYCCIVDGNDPAVITNLSADARPEDPSAVDGLLMIWPPTSGRAAASAEATRLLSKADSTRDWGNEGESDDGADLIEISWRRNGRSETIRLVDADYDLIFMDPEKPLTDDLHALILGIWKFEAELRKAWTATP